MNGTLKNIAILGILVLVVLVSISFFQVQSDSNAKSSAIKVVFALAEKDAKAHIESGEIVILNQWGHPLASRVKQTIEFHTPAIT